MGTRYLKTFEDLGSTDQVQNMGHTETLDWVKLYNQALSSEELPPVFCFWLHHSWKLLWLPSTPFFFNYGKHWQLQGMPEKVLLPHEADRTRIFFSLAAAWLLREFHYISSRTQMNSSHVCSSLSFSCCWSVQELSSGAQNGEFT